MTPTDRLPLAADLGAARALGPLNRSYRAQYAGATVGEDNVRIANGRITIQNTDGGSSFCFSFSSFPPSNSINQPPVYRHTTHVAPPRCCGERLSMICPCSWSETFGVNSPTTPDHSLISAASPRGGEHGGKPYD